MQNGTLSDKITLVLLSAFAFKLLASCITIYAVTQRTAVEVAPASAIFTRFFGVIPASVIVNLVWACTTIMAFYFIQTLVKDRRIRNLTLKVCAFVVIVVAAVDGMWDLAVLLQFNEFYIMSMVFIVCVICCVAYFANRPTSWDSFALKEDHF